MKHETLISVTILTVVTTVVIGVWSSGFGLFAMRPAPANPAWTGSAQQVPLGLFPSTTAINGFDFQGAAPAGALPAAMPAPGPAPGPGPGQAVSDGVVEAVAPKAPNFVPTSVQLYEAHWQGMDTRLLTAELRRKLRLPQGLEGILVGEVSLAAGRSGLLGGDVIVAVEGQPVTTLEAFQEATRTVASRTQASIAALRKSGPKDATGNRTAMVLSLIHI